MSGMDPETVLRLESNDLGRLLDALSAQGYQLLGPTVEDGAIVYDAIESVDDLPIGWTDRQEAGSYRLARRDDEAVFGYVVGPTSWKKFLYEPEQTLFRAERMDSGRIRFTPEEPRRERKALIGVRACELEAIRIHDKVFLDGEFADPQYQSRRENVFIVAVHCSEAAPTCFCDSMNSGPRAGARYDIALQEVVTEKQHYFLVQAGSTRGDAIVSGLGASAASKAQQKAGRDLSEQLVNSMTRSIEQDGLKEILFEMADSDVWVEVSERCLTCGNCTMACPTCFCSTVVDAADLDGLNSERIRHWDSCFNADFSYMHGGIVRSATSARYRQWLTHKLAFWIDQFGSVGCVGCGRCVTWCPVGIDITASVARIRESAGAERS